MVISKNSQLGLMMGDDNKIQLEFLYNLKDEIEHWLKAIEVSKVNEDGKVSLDIDVDDDLEAFDLMENKEIEKRICKSIGNTSSAGLLDNKNSKIYLICEGVEKCSKMIKIGDNFSTKALKNIEFGKHTYLLGKNEMCRFVCSQGAIKGIYWDRLNKKAFEFGFDIENDVYFFDARYSKEFNKVAKIMTFVELGDIEVKMLQAGRNNGKPKKDGKITNTSNYTVYVVDSTWNQLIIRTEGFAVMGHFRLQPCGVNHADRKLIWISAFEKHGYKRRPKAEIIHS